MVFEPFDYSPEFTDVDLTLTNQNLTLKKRKIIISPQCSLCYKISRILQKLVITGLRCLSLFGREYQSEGLLFLGEGSWIDPREEIILNADIQEALPGFVNF